ncbi:hypothetical protein NCC49_002465 [Naganishia albida]|nr:hypothetical protein NCC49_002465 [Naganishia albida]
MDMQQDELTILESIYPDQVTRHASEKGQSVTIRIDIALPTPTKIVCRQLANTSHPLIGGGQVDVSSIGIITPVLPPLLVSLDLAPTYPATTAPCITALRSSAGDSWLPPGTEQRITDELQTLWAAAEGEGVLWSWIDWLASGTFMDVGSTESDITRDGASYIIPTVSPTSLHALLRTALQAHNATTFKGTTFDCGICFDTKKGRACVSLPCTRACVFCLDCLTSCWALAIREGAVEGVECPGWECTKDRAKSGAEVESGEVAREDETVGERETSEVDVDFVRSVVGDELAERYVWLLEKKRVETDPTYTVCPLPHCQAPVPPPSTSTTPTFKKVAKVFRLSNNATDPLTPPATASCTSSHSHEPDDRFRQCPACQFSFCRYCLKTWHGPSPCPLPSTASFLAKYMSLPPESAERAAFEKRYGKKQLARMVAEWEENEANRGWFERFTRACAGCGKRVNKSAGCNHMICSLCQTHFCYRCGTKLRPADPYHHYRTPGSSCFEKLFDADEIARFEREVETGLEAEDLGQADWIEDVFPLQGNGGWW